MIICSYHLKLSITRCSNFSHINEKLFTFINFIISIRIRFIWKILKGLKRVSFLQKSTSCLIMIREWKFIYWIKFVLKDKWLLNVKSSFVVEKYCCNFLKYMISRTILQCECCKVKHISYLLLNVYENYLQLNAI